MMDDELKHYGIKGMKWGVRRSKEELNKSRKNKDLSNFSLKKSKVLLGKTPAMQYKWTDKNKKPVAEFKIWDWWDGVNVSDLEIDKEYRGLGLSYQLLDYATEKCGAKNLAVRKNNVIAKHVYDKYGFKTVDQDDEMYYMTLNKDS